MVNESTRLVRPEHLNHHGFLFGGTLLEWLDEQAYMGAADLLKIDMNLVTVGIDRVEFKHPITEGSIVRFRVVPAHCGKTSLTMYAEVSVGDARAGTRQTVFDAYVTFVCLGSNNKPMPIGDLLVTPITRDTQDEAGKGYWDEVEMQRAARKRPQRNFRELCMMCEAMPHEIDKYVQLWHNNRFVSGKPLHEALGMSQTAYGLWAKGELDYAEYLKQYLQGTWR